MIESICEPYRSRIEELLFNGYSIAEVHRYLVKYFELYCTYSCVSHYIIRNRLDWFIPDKITKGMREHMREKEILDYIVSYIQEHGYSPSVREIGDGVGLRSTSSVQSHLERMRTLGIIETDAEFNTPRAIRVPGYRFQKIEDAEQ